jgi:hypothetical protein
MSDGCGGTLDCGTCGAPQSCGGGGTYGQCGGCTGCYPGTTANCPGTYTSCFIGDGFDHQAIETCQPDGTWGPCVESYGSVGTNGCVDGTSQGYGWVSCSGVECGY